MYDALCAMYECIDVYMVMYECMDVCMYDVNNRCTVYGVRCKNVL